MIKQLKKRLIIVGSGISAAHLTLKLINHQDNNNKLHLWLNKTLKYTILMQILGGWAQNA